MYLLNKKYAKAERLISSLLSFDGVLADDLRVFLLNQKYSCQLHTSSYKERELTLRNTLNVVREASRDLVHTFSAEQCLQVECNFLLHLIHNSSMELNNQRLLDQANLVMKLAGEA